MGCRNSIYTHLIHYHIIIIISRLFLVHLHCIDCLVCTLDPNHTAYQIHILRWPEDICSQEYVGANLDQFLIFDKVEILYCMWSCSKVFQNVCSFDGYICCWDTLKHITPMKNAHFGNRTLMLCTRWPCSRRILVIDSICDLLNVMHYIPTLSLFCHFFSGSDREEPFLSLLEAGRTHCVRLLLPLHLWHVWEVRWALFLHYFEQSLWMSVRNPFYSNKSCENLLYLLFPFFLWLSFRCSVYSLHLFDETLWRAQKRQLINVLSLFPPEGSSWRTPSTASGRLM